MKSQKGITMLSLILYVIAMVIVVGIVATITSFFYSNTENISEATDSLGEFNKFNLQIVSEVKQHGNSITSIENGGTRVTFSSGNTYTFQGNAIYKNKIKISSDITDCQFRKDIKENKEILAVYFETKNFARTVEYVIGDSGILTNTNTEEKYIQISSKQYVQDGLQLHYDAINNTGDGYSNTTTTWRDLSPNHNDGILSNVTWDGNSAVFDGSTSWVNCGEQNSNYQTLVVTFSVDAINTGANNTCVIGNWEAGGGGIFISPSKKISGDFNINNAYQIIASNEDAQLQEIYCVSISYDGTNENMYVNGNKIGNISIEGTIKGPTNSTVYALGVNPINSNPQQEWFRGKIYSAAIYNRALTEEEVMQNYQVDKLRYGIED